nr:immunoglobulin heavy chain junction region [Macaca mulatta]MOW46286.1 immunoglobulin heavy chain junction region [Macaca mulatta]MOW46291.1 immunoglobulin heavy chain junction region [Macaca mulatta]MOW46315.1 immunoglobulin heavy chain junction region [Macaca mulatta]MOW46336.1 immunoglobulin heavy chain junction region [Macaca mulatta]
CANGITALDYW